MFIYKKKKRKLNRERERDECNECRGKENASKKRIRARKEKKEIFDLYYST